METRGVSGAILTGGRSSRMGRDKAFVEVSGERMVVHVRETLRSAGVGHIVAIGGDREGLSAVGVDSIADEWPGEGPLGGILTALRWCVAPRLCVVACDLGMLTPAVIDALIADASDVAVVVAKTDRIEPLCAVWRCDESTVAAVLALFEAGERSVHRVLRSLAITSVEVSPADLSNFNAPQDLR